MLRGRARTVVTRDRPAVADEPIGEQNMNQFRASLENENGEAIADVQGEIESPGEAGAARSGRFEVQETESFMQGVMEGKSFRLRVDGGEELAIKVESVSTSSSPGTSEAEFSTI